MAIENSPIDARARAQSRYYLRNRDRLLAKAKARYHEKKRQEQLAQVEAQNEPLVESIGSPHESKAPKSLFSTWIQRLTGKKD